MLTSGPAYALQNNAIPVGTRTQQLIATHFRRIGQYAQTINRSREAHLLLVTAVGENGLSRERTSIYSIPPQKRVQKAIRRCASHALGRMGAYSSFSICRTLLLICRLPSFHTNPRVLLGRVLIAHFQTCHILMQIVKRNSGCFATYWYGFTQTATSHTAGSMPQSVLKRYVVGFPCGKGRANGRNAPNR